MFRTLTSLVSHIPKKDIMILTENSAKRIKKLLSMHPEATGVLLSVRKRGCNGLTYKMDYINKPNPRDELVEQHGVKLSVDAKSTFFLTGTTMDFVEKDLGSEFVFNNPQSKGTCGCGESFYVNKAAPR